MASRCACNRSRHVTRTGFPLKQLELLAKRPDIELHGRRRPAHPRRRPAKSLRQKPNFSSPINADSTVHPFAKKYFALPVGQIISTTSRRPVPVRGALRGRHDLLARDAMDATVSQDGRHGGGRRSRVVLTSRRWRQVGRSICRRWWQESPITRESTKEAAKPSRGECRTVSAYLW